MYMSGNTSNYLKTENQVLRLWGIRSTRSEHILQQVWPDRPCTPRTSAATEHLRSYYTWWRPWSGWSLSLSISAQSCMEPFQFSYQPGIGVDDAIIFLLDISLETLWGYCFWFLQCFQHHAAYTSGGEAGIRGGGPQPYIQDPKLPHQLPAICEDLGLCVRHSYLP